MFSHLRYFYLISFLFIIGGAFGVGILIRGMVTDSLEQAVKRNNLSLAQGFVNAAAAITPRQADPSASPAILTTLQKLAPRFASNLSVLQFSLYDGAGRQLFNSNTQGLTDSGGTKLQDEAVNALSNSQILNRLVRDVKVPTSDGKETSNTVIQTIYPLQNAAYNPNSPICTSLRQSGDQAALRSSTLCNPTTGLIEIVVNVSGEYGQLKKIQLVSIASTIAIFVVLISVLLLTTSRAETIIAKQHELNLELTAAAATAEAENRDKAQFLANISHELRTPLNAIIGFSEIIKSDKMEGLSPSHQEYIRDIHASGVHLLSLINDILDYSKAEAGKLELEVTENDITKLIRNSMRLVIPRAESAQVTLVEELPSTPIVTTTDAKKLKQVLLNLLSNAVKFTPPGGEVKVSAWIQVQDNRICIEVRDTGIGIAPKDISKVMTPFGQVDSKLSRKYEGTGLGLPLSKKLIEIMGGEFIIQSEVNVGTSILLKIAPLPETHKDLA